MSNEDEFNDLDELMGDMGDDTLPTGDNEVGATQSAKEGAAETETVNGVTIEYGVEVPATPGGGPAPKWPWHAVRVGGSIKFTDPKKANSAVSSAKRWAKNHPNPDGSYPKFVRRSTGTPDNPEFRVFRTQ